jgi:guanine deaminase
MDHDKFLQLAIGLSKQSLNEARFPAGALIVINNEVVSQSVSAKFPAINHHSESDAIDEAMDKLQSQLTDCTLYCSMEPCLMCLSRAYWSGIRKIVFAIKRESVDASAYEGKHSDQALIEQFNAKIELIHVPHLEPAALKIYTEWKEKNK